MSINVTIDGLDTEIDVSLVPSATEINPESYVALRGLKGDKGDDGVVGRDGADGVGITSITQNQDGTLSINLDDGTSYVTEPLKGADGYTPIKGVDYFDGTNGQDGRDGADGYTPVKGVDYFDGVNGEDGEDGVGIASVTKTGSSGLVDTYTITLTNGSVATFTVTNGIAGAKGDTGDTGATGNGIASAVLNADYTLTLAFTDGTSYTTPSIRGEKGEQGDAGEIDSAMSGTSSLPVQNKVIKAYVDSGLSTKADASSVPTKVSDLTNDAGYITGYTETDPTVPSWAKASSKPSYTASEVGALPDTTVIPSKTSDLTNDSGFITSEGNTTYTLTKSGNTIMLTGSDGNNTSVTDANTTYSTMTQAQATAGTSTSGLRISPKVLHDTIHNALPTKVSDLTNDSGYITSSALPTKVSDLTNDSGYLTSYTETGNIEFDTSASTGTTDGDLYALLTDWGWTDCIV